jgi:hypothetical protein
MNKPWWLTMMINGIIYKHLIDLENLEMFSNHGKNPILL